jgi:hypothetical protein
MDFRDVKFVCVNARAELLVGLLHADKTLDISGRFQEWQKKYSPTENNHPDLDFAQDQDSIPW